MFSVTLDSPIVANIIAALTDAISDLPLEVSENGIDISAMDDEKHMAIWVHIAPDMMNFDFDGENMERYVISSEMFSKAVKNVGYPIEIGSTMDGSLKINSQTGRQSYKIKPVIDREPEDGEYYRRKFSEAMAGEGFNLVKILKQNLREAVKTVKVAGDNVKITLDDTALIFSTPHVEIDAEAVAPLEEAVGNVEWSHNYDVKLLKFMLNVNKDNLPVDLYLFEGENDSVIVSMMLSENSFCRMRIAAAPERGTEAGERE